MDPITAVLALLLVQAQLARGPALRRQLLAPLMADHGVEGAQRGLHEQEGDEDEQLHRAGGPLDPRYPVFQIASYDQTLPFYLGRPTLLVEFRDEMALGLEAEPEKSYNLTRWFKAWFDAPQAYALMSHDTAADLAREKVPFKVLAQNPRRVFVARR